MSEVETSQTKKPGLLGRVLLSRWFIWLGGPALFLWGFFAFTEYFWRMDFVPDDLRPMWVEYAKQKSWGFGPGGYDYAVVVYPMPEETARQIEAEGLAFFDRPENVAMREGRFATSFREWKETPLMVEYPAFNGKPAKMIYLSIDGVDYDEPAPFPPWVNNLFNSVVREKGSYYSRGRLGHTIVSPGRRKIIYFHAG